MDGSKTRSFYEQVQKRDHKRDSFRHHIVIPNIVWMNVIVIVIIVLRLVDTNAVQILMQIQIKYVYKYK